MTEGWGGDSGNDDDQPDVANANTAGPRKALTIDKLREAMNLCRALPPRPKLYSSKRYERAVKYTAPDGTVIVLASPYFWQLVTAEINPTYDDQANTFFGVTLFGLPITDLDDLRHRDLAVTIEEERTRSVSTGQREGACND